MALVFMFLKNKVLIVFGFLPLCFLFSCGENKYDNIERNQQIEQKVAGKIVAAREKAVRECNDRLKQMAQLRADSIIAKRIANYTMPSANEGRQNDALDANRRKPLTASQLRALQKKGEINLTLKPTSTAPQISDTARK
jgi:hypothetical protein